ncbi:unnamed protein product, partial [Durusdinium trenchii]
GCGISRDAQERIFKPFEQEHSSSGDSRNFQGLGLGLAVCLDIVQMHNGSIRVESEVGKGSSFIVSLSCLNDAFCEELAPVQVDKEEDSGKGEKSPPRVAREETPQRLAFSSPEMSCGMMNFMNVHQVHRPLHISHAIIMRSNLSCISRELCVSIRSTTISTRVCRSFLFGSQTNPDATPASSTMLLDLDSV